MGFGKLSTLLGLKPGSSAPKFMVLLLGYRWRTMGSFLAAPQKNRSVPRKPVDGTRCTLELADLYPQGNWILRPVWVKTSTVFLPSQQMSPNHRGGRIRGQWQKNMKDSVKKWNSEHGLRKWLCAFTVNTEETMTTRRVHQWNKFYFCIHSNGFPRIDYRKGGCTIVLSQSSSDMAD